MKKYFLSFFVILAFAGYAIRQFFGDEDRAVRSPANAASTYNENANVAPVPSSSYLSSSRYRDGQFTGIAADAYYGNIQVKAIIASGKLTDVRFLDHPHDRGTSIMINDQAMPSLKSEALQAQDANVNVISGATDTSIAFRKSLASALQQAEQ